MNIHTVAHKHTVCEVLVCRGCSAQKERQSKFFVLAHEVSCKTPEKQLKDHLPQHPKDISLVV